MDASDHAQAQIFRTLLTGHATALERSLAHAPHDSPGVAGLKAELRVVQGYIARLARRFPEPDPGRPVADDRKHLPH